MKFYLLFFHFGPRIFLSQGLSTGIFRTVIVGYGLKKGYLFYAIVFLFLAALFRHLAYKKESMDKKIKIISMILGLVTTLRVLNVEGISFQQALKKLEQHESIKALRYQSQQVGERAFLKGTWGEPRGRMMAKNFSQKTLKRDQTSMTGIEFGLSQKTPLTTKYGNIKILGTPCGWGDLTLLWPFGWVLSPRLALL